MSRPADWSALGRDRDPFPGEPHTVRRAAAHYKEVAAEIEHQTDRLRRIGADDDLQGEYKVTLVEASEATADKLEKVSGRYRTTATALAAWPDQLEDFQSRSLTILHEAQAASDAVGGADLSVVGPHAQPPTDATPQEHQAFDQTRARYADAVGDLTGARRKLTDLEDERDDAAKTLAERIQEGADDDVKDSRWENFKDFMDKYAGVISVIAEVLGYVGLALMLVSLFVPGLNLLVIAGMAATGGAFIAHGALAASGNGSWADVGLDVLAIVTMRTSTVVTGGLEAAQGAVRAAGAVRSGRAAASAVRSAAAAERAVQREAMSHGSAAARSLAQSRYASLTQTMEGQMDVARSAARRAYTEADLATTTLSQRISAGLSPEVAALRADMARVAAEFPNYTRVAQAAEAAARADKRAVAVAYAEAFQTVLSPALDLTDPPPWVRLQDKWTREIGTTW